MSNPKIIDIDPLNQIDDVQRRNFFEPLSSRGIPRWLVLALGLLGLVYVLNPTLGLIEFLPDNLPIIGNLDEGAAYLLLMYGIIELLHGKRGS